MAQNLLLNLLPHHECGTRSQSKACAVPFPSPSHSVLQAAFRADSSIHCGLQPSVRGCSRSLKICRMSRRAYESGKANVGAEISDTDAWASETKG